MNGMVMTWYYVDNPIVHNSTLHLKAREHHSFDKFQGPLQFHDHNS